MMPNSSMTMMMNTDAGPTVSKRIPVSIGAMMRVPLNENCCRATALGTLSRPTMAGISACRPGWLNAIIAPRAAKSV